MRSVRVSTASCFGLWIGLCGCYHYGQSPYGGQPYGPYSYPPGGYPIDNYGGSTTPYVPYNSPSGPTPTPLGNPTPNWSPAPGGNPAPRNPATPYEPNGTNGTSPDRVVPNPTDEEGFGPRPGAGLSPSTGPALSGSGIQLEPAIEATPVFPSGAAAPSATVASTDPFESPMRSVSTTSPAETRSRSVEDGRKPFGYDLRNHTWLRGYVDYDPQDQRWIMIYAATPDRTDRYGGSLTLSDHKLLSRVQPQDHVLIEGAVDQSSFDQHGKPLYRIEKMVRLK